MAASRFVGCRTGASFRPCSSPKTSGLAPRRRPDSGGTAEREAYAQRMDAERAITNLIFAYAERIDAGDFEGVADLFAAGRITAEGTDAVRAGRDAVLELYRRSTRVYEDTGTPKTKHLTTNLVVELDQATAQARSYFTVLQ